MPKLPKNVTRLNTPTKANKPTKASTPTKAAKPIAADKPEDLTEKVTPIKKPSSFSLDKFKSKRAAAIANVETLLGRAAAPQRLQEAKDFVRLHPDEENYWSPELCFVDVPIKGAEERHAAPDRRRTRAALPAGGKIKRFRLALATQAATTCSSSATCPSTNLDNSWNADQHRGLRAGQGALGQADQPHRMKASSGYKIDFAPRPATRSRTRTGRRSRSPS